MIEVDLKRTVPIVGVLLAGGRSSRMGGGDKCLLPLGGKPMLAYALERLKPQVETMVINANGHPGRFEAFGLPVIADSVDGYAGPQAPGLSSRDYIPLFVAIFVDFCLLLVSINRPINRFQMLLQIVRDARDAPVGEILARFHDTHISGLRQEFEIFQHAVFDFLGDYYVAVPINAQRTEARYLANLFVGLEGKGIIDRVLLPPSFVVRRKLKLQGSAFAGEQAFRLCHFRNGAWSKLVLDAILGRGSRLDAERPIAEERPLPSPKTNGHTAPDHPEQAPEPSLADAELREPPHPNAVPGGRRSIAARHRPLLLTGGAGNRRYPWHLALRPPPRMRIVFRLCRALMRRPPMAARRPMLKPMTCRAGTAVKPSLTLFLLFMAGQAQAP
jgi:MobA-like NTP transferase domain